MTSSQDATLLGASERSARDFLLGVPPRMFEQIRAMEPGGALVRASHPRIGALRPKPGDRVYLCAFARGKLALIGRLTVDPAYEAGDSSAEIVGQAPFTACRADRIVPHQIARRIRSASGDELRFS